jgi:hypothetical protein
MASTIKNLEMIDRMPPAKRNIFLKLINIEIPSNCPALDLPIVRIDKKDAKCIALNNPICQTCEIVIDPISKPTIVL